VVPRHGWEITNTRCVINHNSSVLNYFSAEACNHANCVYICNCHPWYIEGKAVPLQAWSDPEGSRKMRVPDFKTTAQDGGKVVSLTHRPPLLPGNTPGTYFCLRLATGRIMSLKNSNDTIGIRTRDLPVCSVVLNHYATARSCHPWYIYRTIRDYSDPWWLRLQLSCESMFVWE
jgi:hypothetical protein